MKAHIDKLYQISGKKSRRIIGLMSGTSLDGLDVAVCNVEGSGTETVLELEYFTTVSYSDEFRNEILQIFAKRQIDFQQLCLLNPYIGTIHGKMILDCLEAWDIGIEHIDLIASHGQTVFHAPKKQHKLPDFPNATLQIGDGDHIATKTGIITLSDFRQKHIAAGGEGAPLAVYGDHFLFSKAGENRILLNMGGIANFTFLPASLDTTRIFTTDTGPGNTLLDAYAKRFFHKSYDENGAIAASGKVNNTLLVALKSLPFFKSPFPKTTGPEVFNFDYVEAAIQQSKLISVSRQDIIATLTQLSAETISDAIKSVMNEDDSFTIYASGGGAHNPVLMSGIARALNQPIEKIDTLGVSGDAKEAVLFAVLANEAVAGQQMHFGEKEGVPSVSMGKISFPG
ncbi:anhydro-N-acetylmuramic acid kinase [Dyadobacter chenwenxiniae]|uniref:Anhydro-N-acetylmuramic acid kinase n=1 Tax=Dyadobacter chenwenxiniae TaxID=2906456 RepID=A0A9X1TI15_9BACT|nr:anhydro-N-acetylmuramic acid kinase [Dyadobacter chenwenxiniae]MCF0065365.1 anhydro-N-acetylmuramic acid kinase [Dyadobacter chenwenxiniae]UON82223.1 anhydro-N-acetylmuramic acid kinase [Dyadobacter chenwenxiniae]